MTILRELAGMELAATLTAEYAQFNVVGVLHLRNPPSLQQLRSAFEQLRQRHPLLGARIVTRGKRRLLQRADEPAVTLDQVPRDDAEAWLHVAEDHVNRPIDQAREPLVRCTRVGEDPAVGELVLSFHHGIVDGSCVASLLDEMLTLCGSTGGAAQPLPALELQPSAMQLFPARSRGVRQAWRIAAFMGRQMADELRFRHHNRHQHTPRVQPGHHTRILSQRLGRDATLALVRASRRRRAPLHCVLNAAFMQAVNECVYDSAARLLRYMTFASLRPFLEPPLADHHMGAYLAMLRHSMAMTAGLDLWTLAERINQQLLTAARRGDKLVACQLSPTMMSTVLRHKPGRMAVTALGYTGPVPLEQRYGAIEVEGLNGFVSNIDIGPEAAAQVRLFRGELWLDFMFLASELSSEQSGVLVANLLQRLEEAAEKGQSHASDH